jgi:hypothetical protein
MWVRLDVYHLRNPKMRKAGLFGRALWIAGLCYAYAQDTDGQISADVLDLLAAEAGLTLDQAQEAASKLTDVGVWVLEPDGWRMHDYENCQETSAERDTRRSQDRERQRRRRQKQLADQRKHQPPEAVTRDTGVTHSGVRGPEPEPEPEPEDLVTKRCRETTTNNGTSQSTSISVPPNGGVSQDDRFGQFWDAYPRREGRKVGKAQAQAQWQRLKPVDRDLALVAVGHYAAERGGPGQLSPEDAQRWLRNQRWTEFADPPQPATNGRRTTVERLAELRARKEQTP